LNGRNIPFVNHVKYLIFDKRITRRLHIEMIGTKAFRTLESTPYSKVIYYAPTPN
jgi:hypothetical protein